MYWPRNWSFLLFLLLRIYGVFSDAIMLMNHMQHLKHFKDFRHPFGETEMNWLEARKYIKQSFQNFGLLTQTQTFTTKIATYDNSLIEVEGKNIIGQSVSLVENAPVILIGTYYDSTLERNPLAESGATLSSLLETARGFQDLKRQGSFHQNTTILFVTFDLNTKNYIPLSKGLPGSYFFAQEWLSEFLNGRKLIGAMILGSISSFNPEENSQHLLEGVEKAFPAAYENIKSSQFKGDFLGLISRTDKSNMKFVDTFKKNYEKANSDSEFRVEDLLLQDGVSISPQLLDSIRRSPQFDFWTHNPPFPAMFLTDMDIHRKDFDFENCRRNCTLDRFWNNRRKDFVEGTTSSLLHMILEHQTPIPEENDNSGTKLPGSEVSPSTSISFGQSRMYVVVVCSLVLVSRIYVLH